MRGRLRRDAVLRRGRASGYCQRMASSHRPAEPTAALDASAPSAGADAYDAIAEQRAACRARAERDRSLTSAERLQRLHELCAQLATVTPAQPRHER
jgi:hypothetical protein